MFKRKLLFVTLAFVLWFVGVVSARPLVAQSADEVAILVVDVFDPSPPTETKAELAANNANCVVAPDGQDGSWWGGLSTLTSALHPLSKTHGEAVFDIVIGSIHAMGAQLEPLSLMATVPAIHKAETWGFSGRKIQVVGVDTDEYKTESVVNNVIDVIEAIRNTDHITKFVINMSFGILPCDDMPILEFEDYRNAMNVEELVQVETLLSQLEANSPSVQAQVLQLEKFMLLRTTVWLTVTRPQLEQAFLENYSDVLGDVTDCLTLADTILDNPVLGDPYMLAFTTAIQEVNGRLEGGSFNPDDAAVVSADSAFIPPAALQGELPDQPCLIDIVAINAEEEELAPEIKERWTTLQSQYEEFFARLSRLGVEIIPIAAAGNSGRDFPYAPAYLPGVISVSANYYHHNAVRLCPLSRREITEERVENDIVSLMIRANSARGGAATPTPQPTAITVDVADVQKAWDTIVNPRSNSGEVMMNGVLVNFLPEFRHTVFECLDGTSFAAPRLAAEAGFYLLAGGAMQCEGIPIPVPGGTPLPGNLSLPPLDHPLWDNLAHDEATYRFCGVWNNLVPLPDS